MESTAEQWELFPNIAKEAAKREKSTMRQAWDAVNEHGPLFPPWFATAVLNVSRQRVHQLLEEGKLAYVVVAGKAMIPMASLELYLSEEHKAGRPVEALTMRQAIERCRTR